MDVIFSIIFFCITTAVQIRFAGIQAVVSSLRSQIPSVPKVEAAIGGTISVDAPLNVTGSNLLSAYRFASNSNNTYYIEPANTGTSLTLAGKIGIGTTAPTYGVTVIGDDALTAGIRSNRALLVKNSAGTDVGLAILSGGDNGLSGFVDLYNASGVRQVYLDASSESYIAGGKVGIGTTTPDGTLTVQTSGTTDVLNLFETGGTEVFTVLESGNVGIGTTTPAKKLDIQGDTAISTNSIGGGSGWGCAACGNSATLQLYNSSLGNTILNNAGYNLNFQTASTSRLWIANAGSVGIGTTSPTGALNVSMTTTTSNTAIIDLYSGGTGAIGRGPMIMRTARGTLASPTAVQSGDFILSIGGKGYGATAFPAASKVAVNGFAAENWTDAAQGAYLTLDTTPTGSTTRAERLRIDNAGSVGIGTTTPTAGYKLDIVGSNVGGTVGTRVENSDNTNSTSNAYFNVVVGGSSAGDPIGLFNIKNETLWAIGVDNSDSNKFKFANNSDGTLTTGTMLTVDTSGNVGIGTTNPGYALEVAGTVYASGSSRDYKEHITDLMVDTENLYRLRPVSFDYKPEYIQLGKVLGDGRQIGLIAEEVYQILPELAIYNNGEIRNVDYEKLSVLLLAELQKHKKEIERLNEQINVLDAKIEKLGQ